jgi:aminopeptidase N
MGLSQGFSQPEVDFIKAQVQVSLDTNQRQVRGSVNFDIDIKKDVDTVFLDARNLLDLQVESTTHDNLQYGHNDEQVYVVARFRESENATITINFTSQPNQAMYFIDMDNDGNWEQAWTQGQGKYTSNWLPSIDDVNEKMEWDITIDAPANLEVIANGSLIEKSSVNGKKCWQHDMQQPMSSYLVAIAVGSYSKASKKSSSNVPLYYYYYPNDKDRIWSTYKYGVEMFDILEQEIGVNYPWQEYKQVPVKDFLYAGMENTTATFFDDQFVQDASGAIDRSYVNVQAHELAHQWFGNLVTAHSSKHHWLQEGLATYYAMRAERQLYGKEHFYVQLYQHAEALTDQSRSGQGTALLDPKASSLTFYQHGAWAVHALRAEVGDEIFRQSIQQYLENFAFKTATTDDLLAIFSRNAGKDLTQYKSIWLTSKKFPSEEALKLLQDEPFMQEYLQLLARRASSFDDAFNSYKETLTYPVSKEKVLEMVGQLSMHDDVRKYELLKTAASINNPEIRQLVAITTSEVNPNNQELITDLLLDKSYLTRESSLYLLWNAATNKKQLLETAMNAWQTTNSSLKMAWLALAINTSGYSDEERKDFLSRLQKFSDPLHGIETRTTAFDYLKALNFMSDQNYRDLLQAALQHNWRFYTYARNLIKELREQPKHLQNLDKAIKQLPEVQQDKLALVLE